MKLCIINYCFKFTNLNTFMVHRCKDNGGPTVTTKLTCIEDH